MSARWAAAAAFWILAAPGAALATEPAEAGPELDAVADLEKAFWYCDYVATTEGVLATPVAACRFATERLKMEKFSGNFEAFLAWWRLNKRAEHAKLWRLSHSDAVL